MNIETKTQKTTIKMRKKVILALVLLILLVALVFLLIMVLFKALFRGEFPYLWMLGLTLVVGIIEAVKNN